ncbi:CaiF/GrlA family transcriptional regulator [Salmonella enterica subsp. enterica serovar Louisiana]|uniref:CaiF/GrlA family transcriptional regulator n=1 Tax=Salmonella enteritidis TaxID=149539 RepID=A0A5V0BFF3_SALEN|nr:CaiF/GrlA family transcriptional regulator [Salmonella enterica subsp. enterica serovar Louisiana]EBS5460749.1 CaiF/GrlA family transcriptional regulator [Salmonella enterica subsp. enterica serovar Enteritidis]EBS5544070.1 CaiF/GrlA family transcriptional regulator [Salmonella enterica subsp. enterica serovar Plymouth]ECA1252853.1 CaiF/GrlA family transcriptional regulator [Salmonella enterica subsp. enterica serovar Chailey]ECB1045745.1 CaiF/GrlA family transcriptional regulator [Salmonell
MTKQNNYEGRYLPEGMEIYANCPFFIIVALWCLHRNTWVNRNDIARAFKLSDRKASFQLSYLMNKKHIIDSEIRKTRSEGSLTTCYEVRIINVRLPQSSSQKYSSFVRITGNRRHQVGNASNEERALLRELWPVKSRKVKT